ncbi:MAG: S-layer homology domain-containing protein [Oscillospiraceae bacterium]|nr:S-layer homology domain-containing protein [Oscillospiraceae bacterium]
MKYLLHRLTALLLALLLLCSAGGALAMAAQDGLSDPACVLGATPSEMLAGGGRQLETERGSFYLDQDGNIRLRGAAKRILVQGPAARLNYAAGVLYFGRVREEEKRFDLCAFELDAGKETVLLENFSGQLGQLYLVNGNCLQFAVGDAVWTLELTTGDYRLSFYAKGLRSFVPTTAGPVYALGENFDYQLYAGGFQVAEHVESYYVEFRAAGAVLIYTSNWEDYQVDLAAAFRGEARPAAFAGCEYVPLSADEEPAPEEARAEFETEAERLEREHAELMGEDDPVPAPPDPAEADPNDPQLPPEQNPEEPTEPAEEPTEPSEEPTEPSEEPTEPAEEVTEPTEHALEPTEPSEEPTEPTPEATEPAPEPAKPAPEPTAPTVIPGGSASAEEPLIQVEEPPVVPAAVFEPSELRSASTGQMNIARRARQMLNVPWTARKGLAGYGYSDSSYELYHTIYYYAGSSYKGIPYGWTTGSLVPWQASLTKFVNDSKDPNSVFYTHHSGGRGSQHYGLECSGFVSWAWDLPAKTGNNNSNGIASSRYSTYIGKDYTKIQIGDALVRHDSSWSHSRLVVDVLYESDGVTIHSVEVAEANPTTSHNGCCYTTLYSGSNLYKLTTNSYEIYRSNTRNSASYTHACVVPLEGDYCEICGAGGSWEDPYAGMYVKPGVDVSYAQGTINWKELAPEISFAIVRVGYTGYANFAFGKDSYFEANVKGCEQNGVPYGVYFYAGATTPDQAIQEAETVLEYLGFNSGNPHIPPLGVYYDVEETRNILRTDENGNPVISNQELVAIIGAFCNTLEDCGLKAGVYASTSVWNSRLSSDAYNQWARWVAQWGSNTLTAAKGAHLWQYDNKGSMPGVAAKIDLDYWLGEVGDFSMRCTAVKTAPSCEENGTLTCTSLDYGESLTLPIHALGHLWDEETVSVEATCVGDGVLTVGCSRCDAEKQTPYSDPDNHSFVNYICTRCDALAFEDVKPGIYYYDPVRWAVTRGITAGTGERSFSPNAVCSREQIVTFLWKAAGAPKPSANAPSFSDVSADAYYSGAVRWAAEQGITGGVGGGNFGVGMPCTREQVVTFLWKAAGMPAPSEDAESFLDVPEDAYYSSAVRWAAEKGVTGGVGGGYFGVGVNCTRGQIVTFLFKAAAYLLR